jgi:hypothetical protein
MGRQQRITEIPGKNTFQRILIHQIHQSLTSSNGL